LSEHHRGGVVVMGGVLGSVFHHANRLVVRSLVAACEDCQLRYGPHAIIQNSSD
jgi:pyoverdine/dityrosine biosynthesis protein Dit1